MWRCLFTERKLYTSDYQVIDRLLLLRAHFSVTDVQFNKPPFIFSLFPPNSHVAIFIMRDVIEKAVLLRRVVSHESLSRPIISFHWRQLIPRRQMNNIRTIGKTFHSWQKRYRVRKWRPSRQLDIELLSSIDYHILRFLVYICAIHVFVEIKVLKFQALGAEPFLALN